jgi:hypothetical protein
MKNALFQSMFFQLAKTIFQKKKSKYFFSKNEKNMPFSAHIQINSTIVSIIKYVKIKTVAVVLSWDVQVELANDRTI